MRIAVYGILRNDLHRLPGFSGSLMKEHAVLVGSCEIPGSLYSVGAFPALRLGDGVVRGQLWESRDVWTGELLLRELDRTESYYPDNLVHSMYLRKTVQLLEPRMTAFVYVWNSSFEHLRRVPSGDWKDECASNSCGLTGW